MTIRTRTGISACRSSASVSIASSSSISGSLDLGEQYAVELAMPSAWTAASVSFLASVDGSNFGPLYDHDGNEVTYTGSADRVYTLNPQIWVTVRYIKVRSGTNSGNVDQSASRAINLLLYK